MLSAMIRSFRLSLVAANMLAVLLPAAALAQTQATAGQTPTTTRQRPNPTTARLAASFRTGEFKDTAGYRIPYRYFEPPATEHAASAKYPVILYLHGEEEAGTDNKAQLTTTEAATVWIEPDHLALHPVYVLAPQLARGQNWTTDQSYSGTLALLHQFIQSHPAADANRVYLVGFSMGATGLWNMLLKNPALFAAAMPISGSADKFLGDASAWAALKNTPVIIVHSYDDTVVPVSAALNAAAALQAGGNEFLGYGAPTPALWSPGSTASPHDAWYTAFEKFEVLYNSLFLGDLAKTQHGTVDFTTLYTSRSLGDGITQVWDYALGTSLVIERADKAVIIDATMGHGSIYRYIRDNVLVNKDVPIEVFLTHQHEDHILGLASFVGSPQLKKVYVDRNDSAPVIKILGPDGAKVSLVKDGDLVPLGGTDVEVIAVPGHTAGSIVMKYGRYLFSGDSIGTGYIGVGAFSVEQYIGSLQHLLDRMGPGGYTIYGGHTGELRTPMTQMYVHDLMACAKAIVAGTIDTRIYWRGRELSTRKVSTVNSSSITYSTVNVHRIPGALSALRLSQGTLYPGYMPEFEPTRANTPGFVPSLSYYFATVEAQVNSLDVTPVVLDPNYKSLTINGTPVVSGKPYKAMLDGDASLFTIAVTAPDGTIRIYTLKFIKGHA